MNKLNFAKNKTSAMIALLALFLVVLGCSAEKPAAPPTEAEAQTLVKNTMSEFADAVDKNDFKSFRTNMAKEFQAQYTDEQLKSTFKVFTDQKEDFVPILRDAAKKNLTFSPAFAVEEESGYSVMTTAGTIDSEPQPIKINNKYVYQDGKWKLLKIDVKF